MGVSGYTRRSSSDLDVQTVAIVGIVLEELVAYGLTRERHKLKIELQYAVGETYVVPTIGEQWYVHRFNGVWRLREKIPFNDPTTAIPVSEGQVKVGGRGPIELTGSQVNLHSALHSFVCTTDSRPEGVSEGASVYDSDLKIPIWFNGDDWTDASGTPV